MDEKLQLAPSTLLPQKLTDWGKEPSIQDLKHDLEQAQPSQQVQTGHIQRWNDLRNVRGAAKPKAVKGRSQVQPKLIRRQAEWRYSALTEPFLGSDKLFKVSPATWADVDAAQQNELVLNWQFRTKLNKVKFIDDMVRSTVDDGTCIIKLGWNRQTIMLPKEVPLYAYYQIETEDQLQQLQQAMELKNSNPRGYDQLPEEVRMAVEYTEENGIPVYAQATGETTTIQEEKILFNQPSLEIMNPHNVFIDPSCNGDFEKAQFVVISFETSWSELKKDKKRYKNLDRVNWEGNTPLAQPDHETTTPDSFQFKDKARKKVVAYEYWGFWDIEGNGALTPIVATWIGDVMIRLEKNPFPDEKLPFVLIPYLPVKRELYGEPDAELLEDNQAILGAVTRGAIDLMGKSANAQTGIAKGMLDAVNKRRFDNGQDYEFNPNQNPAAGGLMEHKYPELPQSVMLMLNLQNQEAEALTGVKSFAGGVSGDAYGDVAAGIRGVLDASSKREMAILRRMAKGMAEIAMKLISMNAVWLSEKETVKVTNEQFVEVSREDLKGNFEVIADISTAEVDNQKSQDLAFMLQTMGPNGDWGLVQIILVEIAKLKRMPELAHALKTYQPQPDPLEQQKKQLEIEKLQSDIGKNQAQAELFLAQAKMQGASGDLKNLEYVETETGTKHAREMELQKAQSEGNQNLAVTKALASPTKEGEKAPDIQAAVGFNKISGNLNSYAPSSTISRDAAGGLAGTNPLNLGSQEFNPSLDPALNPAINLS
ncbi:portal protein [Burkholderia phage vB_BpP_HN02]|uniref:Portal protein n=1 Tax=Burkholderia phage vB_BpP_HN02 TaxID=3116925 RepID=A0AAX4JH13_9CAUD